MTATLRAALPEDYDTLASWITDASSCLRWAGPRVSFPFVAGELSALLVASGEKSYCLAEASDTSLGFGQHWVSKPGAVHLGRIIISPDARGRGLGRALVQQLMEKAVQSSGATLVTLRVFRDNHEAVALYSSLGFSVVEKESSPSVLFMSSDRSFGSTPAAQLQ